MVEIFKITGKRIVFVGFMFTIVGMVMLGYHTIIYNLVAHGELPEQADSITAIGSMFLMIGPWVIKGRSIVREAVK